MENFPPNGKKQMLSQLIKKWQAANRKLSNRKISLWLMCGKILEQLIYNKMFEFFIENELISQNQSGF